MNEYDRMIKLWANRILGRDLSPEDEVSLNQWLRGPESKAFTQQEFNKERLAEAIKSLSEVDKSRMDRKMDIRMGEQFRTPKIRIFLPYVAAASVIGILAGAMWLNQRKKDIKIAAQTANTIILPATDKARLRLTNGKILYLDSTKNGQIGVQGKLAITKSGGRIVYKALGDDNSQSGGDNVLSVPRGGQFSLTLPDGTQVWLNSSSDITYPVAFDAERRVKLTGEAFFSVARDAKKPFFVETPHGTIQVLGTSFNLKAYSDDSTEATTLVDGKVKVESNEKALILQPGEQAFQKAGTLTLTHPNVQAVTAWRRGFFSLQDADIQDIMKEFSRFYDVQVVFRGAISSEKYTGLVGRDLNLRDAVSLLQHLHINATLSDRTIIVEPEKTD
jgi:ferric-dicitrate binding protein FerR (iron transport regulator)